MTESGPRAALAPSEHAATEPTALGREAHAERGGE
jgi:hypothetical protein